ncbi:MAG: ATP-binding protein [Syntrophothermus sp.]
MGNSSNTGQEDRRAVLLAATIESAADGILVTDRNGFISITNNKFVQLWNVPRELLDSKDDETLLTYILSQVCESDLFRQKIRDLYANPAMESEDSFELKDGRYLEIRSMPQVCDGETIGRLWNFRDITTQKQLETELMRQRSLLRTIIDNLPDAIYTKDAEFRKTLANKTDLQNMGCASEEDALGKTDFDYFPKEDAESFYRDDKLIIEFGKTVINREESFIDRNGKKNWLLTSKIPIRDEDGKITGLLGIGHNITEIKINEMIREALYEISETAFEASSMPVLYEKIHEVIGILMKADNFYLALYDEETDNISFPYLVDGFDRDLPSSRKYGKGLTEYVLRTGEAILVNEELGEELRRKGEIEIIGAPSRIWLGVPLKAEGKNIGVLAVQDYENEHTYGREEMEILIFVAGQVAQAIERKRKSDKLKQIAQELKEANQSKDKFFSIIAHDLKSPFNGLIGLSDILTDDYDHLSDPDRKNYISHINDLSRGTYALLENLLEWSRLQTGKIEFNPVQFSLLCELKPTLSLVKETALNKNISLHHSIDESLMVYADKYMLQTVVRNLISNAIKFTEPGGSVTIDSKQTGNYIETRVTDTGIGMKQEDISKLFRTDKTMTKKGTANEKGTGLGLLLCKEMIELHGGKIKVESELKKGTTFIFTVPVKA